MGCHDELGMRLAYDRTCLQTISILVRDMTTYVPCAHADLMRALRDYLFLRKRMLLDVPVRDFAVSNMDQ
jgi:hypothetical protein